MKKKDNLFIEKARSIPLQGGVYLIARTFFDIKLASIYYSIKDHLINTKGKVLDVGCGNSPYRFLLKDASYYGIDHKVSEEFSMRGQEENIEIFEGNTFPKESNSFDMVFHTEVLEHVNKPLVFLQECNRVLKVGKKLIFTVPFSYKYHYSHMITSDIHLRC